MKALEVLLGYGCNEKCLFCSQELSWRSYAGLPFDFVTRQLYEARAEGYRSVCFSGGEPTLRKDLAALIAFARRLGYDYIRVQTNAVKLSDPAYADALVSAGASYFRCSLHGHTPELHDGAVGLPGALAKAARGIANLKGHAGVGINLVLHARNVRALPEICADFVDRGWGDIVLIFPLYEGDMVAHEAEMRVSMTEAAPAVRAAFRVFDERGAVRPRLLNFTPCAAPELAEWMLSWSAFSALVVDAEGRPVDLYMASHDDRVKPAACAGCAYDGDCLGFKTSYRRRHEDERLPAVPRRAARAAERAGSRILALEDADVSAPRAEIARAIMPVPETGGARGPLLAEQVRVRLDPGSRRIDEERRRFTLAAPADAAALSAGGRDDA
jgi:cyclic pyranopterin phosphate synthase